ncbi:helix-turn-helix domain-containing protein [Kitasatospora sp. YST-16]|uniref:helix-turn-helix domain-containing protein n=1 Tax=Kitasatospora sp. YST-16 TaxID=2998080 RepID=UPI002284633A|nr:helix-turn-helix domain-containing protein [Kitasatospora sp. YST-16]WAL72807.1 helix-turn-helix domain-containing protein [Kitasatospora sp. YST-16]WNW38857.1 helix-turn-helix domain-containing protein [Streptomyces sp. Li-HN-5-13]
MSKAQVPGLTNAGLGVVTASARDLYKSIINSGGRVSPGSVAAHCGEPLQELVDIGLLISDVNDPQVLVAVDPQQLADGLSASWQRSALELMTRAASVSSDLHDLTLVYGGRISTRQDGGNIEHVSGKTEINRRLSKFMDQAAQEVLSAQPGGGARSFSPAAAIALDVDMLRRGVARRTIYQPSTRYSAPAREYVAAMTKEGGEVRTLGEPFTRLIVIDSSIAIIPFDNDNERAAIVMDEAVVAYLVDSFEICWERAIPFPGSNEVPPEVVSLLRQNIIRMLLQGVGHRVIARNLGLSERTLARHIAELREEYDAETLFQLGWKLAQGHRTMPLFDSEGPQD